MVLGPGTEAAGPVDEEADGWYRPFRDRDVLGVDVFAPTSKLVRGPDGDSPGDCVKEVSPSGDPGRSSTRWATEGELG